MTSPFKSCSNLFRYLSRTSTSDSLLAFVPWVPVDFDAGRVPQPLKPLVPWTERLSCRFGCPVILDMLPEISGVFFFLEVLLFVTIHGGFWISSFKLQTSFTIMYNSSYLKEMNSYNAMALSVAYSLSWIHRVGRKKCSVILVYIYHDLSEVGLYLSWTTSRRKLNLLSNAKIFSYVLVFFMQIKLFGRTLPYPKENTPNYYFPSIFNSPPIGPYHSKVKRCITKLSAMHHVQFTSRNQLPNFGNQNKAGLE